MIKPFSNFDATDTHRGLQVLSLEECEHVSGAGIGKKFSKAFGGTVDFTNKVIDGSKKAVAVVDATVKGVALAVDGIAAATGAAADSLSNAGN